MTAGTIVVLVIVVAIVAAIIIKAIRDRKAGKNSCGGDCAHCGYGCEYAEEAACAEKGTPGTDAPAEQNSPKAEE